MSKLVLLVALGLALSTHGFTTPSGVARTAFVRNDFATVLRMADSKEPAAAVEADPMDEAMIEVDEQTLEAMRKAKRAGELRAQEVFMKKSTGFHKCTNCDWQYDETKGDSMMIGGMIKPDTKFKDLPADWRCPVCRASKDAFAEVVEEIPGFEVNQGYGFGTNSWTAGQKNLAVFGSLGLFFLLFISGYGMS
jgi:rubredoxin